VNSMQHWTPEQWGVFAVTIAAGVIAAALLYAARSAVLGWTAPAPMRRAEVVLTPRPSLMLTQARMTDAEIERFKERWNEAHANGRPAAEWLDPMRADFTDPGIGALASIQAIDADPQLRTAAELQAEEDDWINAYADLTPMMPETAKAHEQMRVALEPAMRTAKLWRIRGEGSTARQWLNDWRMDTPTGEYSPIDRQYFTAYALLVS